MCFSAVQAAESEFSKTATTIVAFIYLYHSIAVPAVAQPLQNYCRRKNLSLTEVKTFNLVYRLDSVRRAPPPLPPLDLHIILPERKTHTTHTRKHDSLYVCRLYIVHEKKMETCIASNPISTRPPPSSHPPSWPFFFLAHSRKHPWS